MEELLRKAAARGDSEQVARLLREGARNIPDENGRNALHLAAAGGFSDVVAALLLARWDVNLQDAAGCTALQRAAAEGHLDIVKQLIGHGADVNIQDRTHGNTALHEASWRGYSKCVEALCRAPKVNLQVKNAGGFAPLHLACQNGHNQSCRELLMANCNPDIQNNYGDTPLHTSARYGHAGVTRILISGDCHMSDQNKNGDTALHITSAMGRRKLTRILLEAGCDPNRRNKQNERAKDIAIRKDLNEILEIIDTTVPIKKKEKHKKDKKRINENKRGKNESGSSKDSARPKDKKKSKNDHQVHFENVVDTKWSPYGCHYYPDSKNFPKPKLDSLPHEPLQKGEQYYLDLAGNIRKGPVGVGYTCYCAPFFRHMEERLHRDKKELKDHIDAAQIRLDKKVTSLEVKTRSRLNEITRSMALERAKCQQRHLHLEQWLIRGSVFRNSEKPKPSDFFVADTLTKSRSLENVLEENLSSGQNKFHRSVDVLNDRARSVKEESDDLKNRSSSREGKESGKGSSEIGDLGTSDGEDKPDDRNENFKGNQFSKRFRDAEEHERRLRRTTREISEKIDEAVKTDGNPDGLKNLYEEMLKWKSYHSAYDSAANQRSQRETSAFESPTLRDVTVGKATEGRRFYRDPLKDPESSKKNSEVPAGESTRESVKDIVSRLQKQYAVQELVAKIQKKTGLVHKSAQKWKENKLKNKEKLKCSGDVAKTDKENVSEKGEDSTITADHNYENVRRRAVSQQENLSRLPYRYRSTVYSPSPNEEDVSDRPAWTPPHQRNETPGYGRSRIPENQSAIGDPGSEAYVCGRPLQLEIDPRSSSKGRPPAQEYSPTQNDSGYSTKPYGGSSTGPSPSLSGQDFDYGTSEMHPYPSMPLKTLEGTTSSLV